MAAFADNMRLVFWIATVPAAFAALVVWFGVKDHEVAAKAARPLSSIRLRDLRALPGHFWQVIAIAAVFTLARFSEAFLVLKANAVGLPLTLAPMVLVAMSVVYAAGSYPAGAWADRTPVRRLLIAGLACLMAADLVLAAAASVAVAFVGIALWGGHMALSQGLMGKLVADHAPPELRGSSFGVFHLTTGLATLAASVSAGLLWDQIGPAATFVAGALFAALALGLASRSERH